METSNVGKPTYMYEKLCGEIYVTIEGIVVFHCTLCEDTNEGFFDYKNHLSECHNINYDSPETRGSSPDTINEEDELFFLWDTDSNPLSLYFESEDDTTEIEEYKNSIRTKRSPNEKLPTPKEIPEQEAETGSIFNRTKYKSPVKKVFKCTKCEYSCNDKSNLAGHIKRHSSFKPYLCTECTKGFYTNSELKRHIASHRGERPFLCHDCGQSFTTKDKLELHFKRHLNIRDKVCPICQMKFYNSSLLSNHLTVHSEIRPHKCNCCEASFKRRTGLLSHMKVHQNKREYQCKLCPASFNQNPGLHSHMKCKHPDAPLKGNVLMPSNTKKRGISDIK